MNTQQNKGGQALLIVLLALAAVASVALTVSTRTTTDVSVTTDVEDSQRAFTAAEAGIEKVLLDEETAIDADLQESVGSGGATYTARAEIIPSNARQYAYPFELRAGDISTLWFMSHDTDNQLTCSGAPCFTGSSTRVCWGAQGTNSTDAGALEVSVYYQNPSGDIVVARTTVDASGSRRGNNQFSLSGESGASCGTIDGVNYAFSQNIDFNSLGISNYATAGNLKMMRVRMLYNASSQPIGFRTSSDLPAQGVQIESLGSAGTASRRLQAFSLYPVVPSMFEAALFSPPGIVKN